MKASIIESERLVLKPLDLSHLSNEYVNWLNDSEVSQYIQKKIITIKC